MIRYKMKSVIAGLAVISCSQLSFSEIIPLPHPDGIVWTNDDGSQSNWELMGDVFTQTTPNKDKEPWGDKYYIIPDALDSVSQDQYTIAVDLLALDYAGGTGLWQGLLIGLDEDNPSSSEKVAVIIEKSEKVGYCGLRIHHNGNMSELVPVEQPLLQWQRLIVEVKKNSTVNVKILDESNASQNPNSDWDLVYQLNQPISLNNTAVAIGAAAEFGFETNPRVGFANLQVSSGQLPSVDFCSRETAIEYQSAVFQNTVEIYRNLTATAPNIDKRIQEINAKSSNILENVSASNARAKDSINNALVRIENTKKYNYNPINDQELYDNLQAHFLQGNSDSVIQLSDEFEIAYPDSDLIWKVRIRHLLSLGETQGISNPYLEVHEKIIDSAPRNLVIDALYNQSYLLYEEDLHKESRQILNTLMDEYGELNPAIWSSYLNSYVMLKELDELESIISDALTREMGDVYDGVSLAHLGRYYYEIGDKDEALRYFSESIKKDVEYNFDFYANTMAWAAYTAIELNDFQNYQFYFNEMDKIKSDYDAVKPLISIVKNKFNNSYISSTEE